MPKQNLVFTEKMQQLKNANAITLGTVGKGGAITMYNLHLKSIVLSEVHKGNKVRILDVAGEFTELVKQLGGRTVALDDLFSNGNFDDEIIVSFSLGNLKTLDSVEYQPQVFVI